MGQGLESSLRRLSKVVALRVQLVERAFSDLPLVQQRGDQDLAIVARQITPTTRVNGKPTPSAWQLGCGYCSWFSGVSGIEIPVPSTSFT